MSHITGNLIGMSSSFNAAGAAARDEEYVSFKKKYSFGKYELWLNSQVLFHSKGVGLNSKLGFLISD